MAGSIERRNDGSIALSINDDLQFDSKDEHIYHEGLVLPALSLVEKRIASSLNVLIIGGGDGLVARELFKSARINKVDLVDYDPEILNYAKVDFATINQSSLSNPKLSIHIQDAWQFVEEAQQSNSKYHLIISDLTVPEDANSARFHCIEWYEKLSSLLTVSGLLAVNGVSAQATPEAFWSVFNSISKSGLQARPYHVHIPSFSAKGFGPDWAFFIASHQPLFSNEFDAASLAEPRIFIEDKNHMLKLFDFPKEIFAYQNLSAPFNNGSDILIHYFNNARVCFISHEKQSAALSQINMAEPISSQMVWEDIVKLMPGLQEQCPPELIAEFVENPAYFLDGIDLQSLVTKLLQRAKELPEQLVTELELLKDKLHDWAGDHLALFALGQRVITVLTVVIVIGNVLYPDSVYGKGDHAHDGGGHRAEERRAGVGVNGNGRRWVNGQWVNNPNWRGVNYVNRNPALIKNATPRKPIVRPNTTGIEPSINQSIYLSIVERDIEATKKKLSHNKEEILFQKAILEAELKQYKSLTDAIVNFGINQIPKGEAIRRTQLSILKANNQIAAIDKQISQVPSALEIAKIAFAGLQSLEQIRTEDEPS
jgi:spermidine synthase